MFDRCIHSLVSLRLESFVIQTVLRAGYALSSVEGRVAMEFFELSEASQAKKYEIVFLVPGLRCYSQASPLHLYVLPCMCFPHSIIFVYHFYYLLMVLALCRYAFKCHRKSEAGRDIVYPVNAIAFHPM